jgi:hypothetical protein
VTPQSLPIPQTQVPYPPSSSLCLENTEKASEAISEWLHWPYPTTRKPWCTSNRVSKPPNPHAKLSLLRATRIVPTVTIYYVFGSYCSGIDRTCSGIGI